MSVTPKGVFGQPPHVPTEQQRRIVRNLAGLGMPHKDIARVVEISIPTLNLHYPDDIEAGRAEANLKVAQSMFKAATREGNPNVVAGMFWLKNRAGWKDIAGGNGTTTNALHLHLTAAQNASKEMIADRVRQDAPTIPHEPITNGTQHTNILTAPPPLE